jgi:hypothetical protein
VDVGTAGIKEVWADLDGMPVTTGQMIDLHTLSLGEHTLTVYAMDKAYNQSTMSVTFSVATTVDSLVTSVNRFASEGKITDNGVLKSLLQKLQGVKDSLIKGQTTAAINRLAAFINEVQAQSGKHITEDAANLLIADAQWLIEWISK